MRVDLPNITWPESIPRTAVPLAYQVLREHAGMRLDRYLTLEMTRLSRTRAARIADHFAFDLAGTPLRAARLVRNGEIFVLFRLTEDEPDVPRNITFLREDEWIVAVDKPAGLPVHPTARHHRNTLLSMVAARFPRERIELCHRLDKETSGIVVLARTLLAETTLKRAFADRQVHKTYVALVHGEMTCDVGDTIEVEAPMALEGGEVSVRMAVRSLVQGGLPSHTTVKVVQKLRGFTVVHASPHTGRQHQIRVHLAHIGHPIVGDKLYAHGTGLFLQVLQEGMTDASRRILLLERHALHAHQICFEHPGLHESIEINAPIPEDIQTFVDQHAR